MGRFIYPICTLNKVPYGLCKFSVPMKWWLLKKTATHYVPSSDIEGTSVNLVNSGEYAPIKFDIKGNTIQEGTPTPENEVPINSVGDNVNLFDISTNDYLSNCTLSDGVYTSGTLTTSSRNVVFGYDANNNYTFKPNKTYYLRADVRLKSGSAGLLNVLKPNTSGFDVVNVKNQEFKNNFQEYICAITNNTESDIVVGRFLLQPNNSGLSDAVLEIKNVKLAEVNSSYSPYNMGSITIDKSNKNLFDKDNTNILTGFLADGGTFNNTTGYKTLYIHCQHNTTYTISKLAGTMFRVGEFTNIPVSGASWITRTKDDSASSITFTTTTGNYLAVTYYKSSDTSTEQEMLNSIQIEIGNQATTYIAHQGTTYPIYAQSPFRAIGDVRDDFVKQAGVWYERHKIGRAVLDGTESGWGSETVSTYFRTRISIADKLNEGATRKDDILCNYFKNSTTVNYGICFNYSTAVYFYPTVDIESLDDFKTWLSTHNTEVIYVLAEPTLIECTDEQAEQLEAIMNDRLYLGGTTFYSTDIVPPYLNVQYYTAETEAEESEEEENE